MLKELYRFLKVIVEFTNQPAIQSDHLSGKVCIW